MISAFHGSLVDGQGKETKLEFSGEKWLGLFFFVFFLFSFFCSYLTFFMYRANPK